MKKLIFVLAVAFSFPALAAPSNSGRFTTIGNSTCADWFDPIRRPHATTWLMGYLSGMNAMYHSAGTQLDPLVELQSPDQAMLWLDNWCRAHPLEMMSTGVQGLFKELTIRQGQK